MKKFLCLTAPFLFFALVTGSTAHAQLQTIHDIIVWPYKKLTGLDPTWDKKDHYRLIITVMSDDRKEAIEGATIRVFVKTDVDSYERNENTDWEGNAYRGFNVPGRFTINIDHPDFIDAIRTLVIRDKTPDGDFKFTVYLKRRSDSKLVIVDVVSQGDKAPVYDAQIVLDDNNSRFSGSTNNAGIAVIKVDEGGEFTVKITHYGYDPIESRIRINKYDDTKKQYPLSFEMHATNEFKRTIIVTVRGKKSEGEFEKIRFATVRFTCDNAVRESQTDGDGVCEFKHSFPPGEEVKVEVNEEGFVPQSKTFLVRTNGLGKGSDIDQVGFVLIRETGDKNDYDPTSVVGTWTWSFAEVGKSLEKRGTVTFDKNGTMNWSGGSHGTWTQSGNSVTLTWQDNSSTDGMTLSADGHNLSGTNNTKPQMAVEGTRGTATDN